jgi:hypothetical protein
MSTAASQKINQRNCEVEYRVFICNPLFFDLVLLCPSLKHEKLMPLQFLQKRLPVKTHKPCDKIIKGPGFTADYWSEEHTRFSYA